MLNLFLGTYKEQKEEAVIFQDEAAAAHFLSRSGGNSAFPVCGFCAAYTSNGETDIDKKWYQWMEAIKFGKNVVIMVRTIDGGRESVRVMTKKEHLNYCVS